MKCKECGKLNGNHELNCVWSQVDLSADDELEESRWVAVLDNGRRKPFRLAPHVDATFARHWAERHRSRLGLDTVPWEITDVERVG